MFNRQKSLRISFVGIALILVTGLIFAAAFSSDFGLLSSGKVSAQERSNPQDVEKKKDDIAVPAEMVADLTEPREAESVANVTGEETITPTQKNASPDSPQVITGIKNIPGDYATLNDAITDLNTQGVGTGGVTFNVLAGNPQTAPAGGYIIGGTGSLVLTTTNATDTVTITGNGNTITAPTPQTTGNLNDAIIKLIGADFITIQGFTMQENPGNTVTAAATNTMTEFGVALFYVSLTDGAKNNTIQNNTITLNRAYQNTFGIYSNTRASSTAVTTTAEVTAASGSNSNNKIYGNNISNVDYGIVFVGAGTTLAAIDTGNDFGGTSAATGNTITNFGYNGTTISSYVSVTGSNFAMYLNQQINDNASFNTITSAAGLSVAAVQHGGIIKAYSVASPTAGTATTTNLNNNTVTLNAAATTAQFTGVSAQGMTNNIAATINMNNNLITGSISGAATSATFLGLFGTSGPGTFNINGNTVRGVTSTATTGGFVGVQQQTNGVVTALNINNNKIGDTVAGAVTFSSATSGTVSGFTVTSTGAASTAAITITGNDIRGIVHSVAATSAHSYISNAAASLSQNISTNTFTNLNVNTTGSVTFISDSVSLTSTGTKNINGNSIVTAFNKGGAGGTITFYGDGASSVTGSVSNNNNNNFSNVTFTGATTFNGWLNQDGLSATSGPTKTVNGNTFSNISGGSSAMQVLTSSFGGGTNVTNSNTISNVTGTGAIIGLFIGTSSNVNNASLNTISTLSTTGASAVTAFSVAGGTTTNVFRNKIYDIQANNASGTVNGLLISGGTTVTAYNNLIGDLRTPSANAANPLNGINITGGTTVNIYYNTVYLNGASTGALFGSSAIFASTTPTVTLRNNIFDNASTTTGAGLAAAYRRSSTTLTTYAAASNNNDFVGSTIFTDGTNTDTTIGAYKTRVSPRDSASFSEVPNFLSTTGSSASFLHISTATATQLESGGAPISGITDDFDGDTRNAATPDIGADEFGGIPLDMSAPVINYTPFSNTALTTNRVLTVTITDATGVATGGLSPRIYFKRQADASYVSTQCVMTGGTAQNGTYNCTIDYSLLTPNTASVGDIIQYFVVAQDTATTPNVGSNPGAGFAGTSVNTVTTPPTTPNQYTIIAAFPATVTVGAMPATYQSLTNTGGLFEAMNAGVFTGNTTVTITSDLTGETGTVALNQLPEEGAGAGTFTVTIVPSGVRSITGSSATSLIRLNGADRVTIDGSQTGSTDRSLTITNTNVGTTSAVIQVQSGTSGAQNDTIKNVVVVGNANTTTQFGIAFGGAALASLGTDNDNGRVQNCDIRSVQYGVVMQGASVANKDTGAVITQNLMNNTGTASIGRGAIIASFEDGIQITENTIGGIVFAGTGDVFGISLGGVIAFSNTTVSGGSEVSNAIVARNNIGTVQQTNTYSSAGIIVTPATTGTNRIVNNFISGVLANGTSPDFGVGIFIVESGTDSTTQVYHNSVSMTGTLAGADQPQYALAVNGTDPLLDVRNNIFLNSQVTGTTSYAVGFGYSTFVNLTSDFNDLFVPTSGNFAIGRTVNISSTGGTNQTTLAALRTATGKDANSISGDPLFTSATNLHIVPATGAATVSPVSNAGTPIAGVTVDIDNDTRSTTTPDIGADEFTNNGGAVAAGTYSNITLDPGTTTLSGIVTVTGKFTVPCGGTVAGASASNFVVGNVQKNYCTTETFVYPVGDNTGTAEYSPMTANITALGTNPSSLTVSVTDAPLPGLNAATAASRYWTLTEGGDLTATLSFNYLEQDTADTTSNTDENNYRVFKREAGVVSPQCSIPCNDALNNIAGPIGGVTQFSDWGIGNDLAPTSASVEVGGRIVERNGRGVFRARVTMTDTQGNVRTAFTNPFGYYRFADVPAGQNYVFTATHIRYRFGKATQVRFISEETDTINFTALDNGGSGARAQMPDVKIDVQPTEPKQQQR